MKVKILTLAVAAALAAGSASAAITIGDITGGTINAGNTAVIYVSGSSATNTQLDLYNQNVLCDSANYLRVKLNASAKNDFASICKPKTLVFTGKTYVAVVKNSNGGSGKGIGPEAADTTLAFLDPFSCSAVDSCSTINVKPSFGLSDEEPGTLIAANATPAVASGVLHSDPLNVVTFGTPVTLGLYRALQTAQVRNGTLATGCDTNGAIWDTEACMPSLSKSAIASIFTGKITDWTQMGLCGGSDGLTNGDICPSSGDTTVYVARRVFSSGTMTDARLFFLNDPCAPGMTTFIAGDISTGGTLASPVGGGTVPGGYYEANDQADACNKGTDYSDNGVRIFEGSGSGNVETCVSNHDRNGRWAISINSIEFPAVSSDTFEVFSAGGGSDTLTTDDNKKYQRHIKLDGIAPSTWSVALGKYQNFVEATMNYNPSSTGWSGNVPAQQVEANMVTNFNSAVVLGSLNAGFNTNALWAGGDEQVGIMSPALASTAALTGTPAAKKASEVSSPRGFYTHGGNSCQPALLKPTYTNFPE